MYSCQVLLDRKTLRVTIEAIQTLHLVDFDIFVGLWGIGRLRLVLLEHIHYFSVEGGYLCATTLELIVLGVGRVFDELLAAVVADDVLAVEENAVVGGGGVAAADALQRIHNNDYYLSYSILILDDNMVLGQAK